ncbi:uncharacterized protein LOC134189027 isoform X1 [Corticium candelabrum]|uniref:uncharacterized protein LOC134189027 isoform X1 n=1 Tax=Corticium candelabrum TaxID=121492 RepID=UPI002E275B4B|nr:uncharacterized protein LOC134189027 isoform X1 [Corticium candelabrum]
MRKNDCHEQSFKATVTAGNIDMLKNCLQSNNHLELEAETSALCDWNIEWRLSVTESRVPCKNYRNYQVLCTIELKRELDGKSVSPSVHYQERLHLAIKYSGGHVTHTALSNVAICDSNGTCQFTINSSNVCNIGVTYINPWSNSTHLKIDGKNLFVVDSCKHSHVKIIVLSSAGGAIVIIIIIIILVIIRLKAKQANEENGAPCRYGSINASDSVVIMGNHNKIEINEEHVYSDGMQSPTGMLLRV